MSLKSSVMKLITELEVNQNFKENMIYLIINFIASGVISLYKLLPIEPVKKNHTNFVTKFSFLPE